MYNFKDKVVLITGASGGIGSAIAKKFSQDKAKLALNDMAPTEENLKKLAEELKKLGAAEVKYYLADISKYEDVEKIMANIQKDYGRLDVLVNNAGVIADRTLAKMTKEEWQKVIDVDLTGIFNCSKLALPLLIPNQGKIISISSIVGQRGNFGQTNYAAAKAGIIGFTKSLSKEVGRFGVRVNAVCPGLVETRMTETIPDQMREMIKRLTSLGRMGKPEEIANLIAFLASDESSFITGSIVNIDGGLAI
jgi:3-oxoacyl-[acyl-carrier protein] reductase